MDNVEYKLERFYSPSESKLYEAELPEGIHGEFKDDLKAFVVYPRLRLQGYKGARGNLKGWFVVIWTKARGKKPPHSCDLQREVFSFLHHPPKRIGRQGDNQAHSWFEEDG